MSINLETNQIADMKHQAIIELWDDGIYSAYVPKMKKCDLNAQGKTVEEVKNNLEEAVSDYVTMFKNQGKDIPKELLSISFEYKYDLASFFEYFDWINVSKLADKAKINPSLLRQYKNKITFASEKQTQKIQETINTLGEELLAVRL